MSTSEIVQLAIEVEKHGIHCLSISSFKYESCRSQVPNIVFQDFIKSSECEDAIKVGIITLAFPFKA